MSYGATIHFKSISAEEVYPFFQKLKTALAEKFEEIAKDNFLWMPSIRNAHRYKDISPEAKMDIDRAWVLDCLFKFRYFYIPEHCLLGIFSVPREIEGLFDNVTYFQNSCDQDYDFDEWNGIPIFEQIASKWKNTPDKEMALLYAAKGCGKPEELTEFDYYRRSFAYDEIWEMFDQYLFNDELCVYLSLFGGYESFRMSAFVRRCEALYEELEQECREKAALKQMMEG